MKERKNKPLVRIFKHYSIKAIFNSSLLTECAELLIFRTSCRFNQSQNSMKKVKDLLAQKKGQIQQISAETTVFEALEKMLQMNIGSLVVVDQAEVKGIFTERDYARKVILQGKSSRETSVGEIMNEHPFYVQPNDTIEHCMSLMSDKMVRYLLVSENRQELMAVLSIGDLVRFTMEEQKQTINAMQEYINRG